MPNVNWDKVSDNSGYAPLPDGKYKCKVKDVDEVLTKSGDPMFRLTLVVTQGEHTNRLIWDNLTFSEKGLSRVKLVAHRLGVELKGEMVLTPGMLKDAAAFITVYTDSYVGKDGQEKKKNVIPFDGYDLIDGGGSDDDLPL